MTHLSNIRIVLVETSHPGNIGAAARAMFNMELSNLYLVKPRTFPHEEATARATGADFILSNAIVCESLAEALADCTLVIATSARARSLQWPVLTPNECAQKILKECANAPVAVVFGRESSGLTNEELHCCQFVTQIPANPEFSSLNIASALQILSYEIYCTTQVSLSNQEYPIGDHPTERPATSEEIEGFYQHLQDTLAELGFIDPNNPRHLMRRMRRLFSRTRLSLNEVNILRGILTAIREKCFR